MNNSLTPYPKFSAALAHLSPGSNLDLYLKEIRKFPILKVEEEYMLAKRWKDDKDVHAAQKLVTSHLRLVAKIAVGYRGYGLPLEELIAEGNVGMMQAVKGYDPDRGFRLATYAVWWIRSAIQSYIIHSWSLVKIGTTTAQKKLFFNLRKLKKQISARENQELSPEDVRVISEKLNVPEEEVVHMNTRMTQATLSLNAPLSKEREEEWQDWIPDETQNQEILVLEKQEVERKQELLRQSLKRLSSREQFIIQKRHLSEEHATLEELAQELGVSRERVRQVEVQAFQKLRKFLYTEAMKRQMTVS